jgi:hypothetical protein
MANDKRVHRTVALNITLASLGVGLLIASAYAHSALALTMSAIGGALLGSSVGGFWSLLRHFDLTEQLFEIVESLRHSISSSEADLGQIRKKYYHYHVSVRERQRIWIYSVMDFSQQIAPGCVRATVRFKFAHSNETEFHFKAYRLGDLLLLTENADPGKPINHCGVFPFFGKSYAQGSHGLAFHETWDFEQEFSPCLIADRPLVQGISEGVVPSAYVDQLDSRWAKMMEVTPVNVSAHVDAPHSVSTDLTPYRKRFFHYHLTRDTTGQQVWHCKVLDFRNGPATDRLTAVATIVPRPGEAHQYMFEAKCLGNDHVILSANRLDKDSRSAVEIFPFWAGHADVHCSFRANVDWGDRQLMSVGLMSESELAGIGEGTVTNQPDVEKLLKVWEQRMSSYTNLIPIITSPAQSKT